MSVLSQRNFVLKDAALPAGPTLLRVGGAARPVPQLDGDADRAFAMRLLQDGAVPPHKLLQALSVSNDGAGRLVDTLLARRLISESRLYRVLSDFTGLGLADVSPDRLDARLIDRLGAEYCQAHQLLPWRNSGGITMIATAHPETFHKLFLHLQTTFGPIAHTLAPPGRIEAALLAIRGHQMAVAAETRLPLIDSCREFRPASPLRWVVILGLCAVVAATIQLSLSVLLLWATATLALTAIMKGMALFATLRRPPPEPENPAVIARLPVVSIIVALYKEADIAARLVRRLGRLDYPRDRLDIVLVVEEEDNVTRNALRRADLPSWMRVVVAPHGRVKTKPRALNFALTQCRGSIVGVYDAEDAPEPDQIHKVVTRFAQRSRQVACLQGKLDFYNPTHNWLSRCFTIEYATWFRVILPGLERLGVPLPLGGTTLFFRRDTLEELGGWDAHNVTEDADLGLRLARRGYRTELLDTTTFEEANCVALPWVKQRSRWIKGYMMTYLSHMRDPRLLFSELGLTGFIGFQVLFLGSMTQALLAPLMWSLLSLHLGFGHPVEAFIPSPVMWGIITIFAVAEILNISLGIVGLRRSGHPLSRLWVPTLSLYFPLQAFASYKALWELLRKPFYWDKTSHGALSPVQG